MTNTIYAESLVYYVVTNKDGLFTSDGDKCYSMFEAKRFGSLSEAKELADTTGGSIRKIKAIDIGNALED